MRAEMGPEVGAHVPQPLPAGEAEICLVEEFEPGNAVERVAPIVTAFYDVLANMRLTQQEFQLIAEGAAINLIVSSQHGVDSKFAEFMTDYGMPAK